MKIILATAAVGIMLTGCGSTSSATPVAAPVTVTATPVGAPPAPTVAAQPKAPKTHDAPAITVTTAQRGQILLTLLKSHYDTSGATDAQILHVSHLMCTALDQGNSFTKVALVIVKAGYSASEAGYWEGLAIGAFCPSHKSDIGS